MTDHAVNYLHDENQHHRASESERARFRPEKKPAANQPADANAGAAPARWRGLLPGELIEEGDEKEEYGTASGWVPVSPYNIGERVAWTMVGFRRKLSAEQKHSAEAWSKAAFYAKEAGQLAAKFEAEQKRSAEMIADEAVKQLNDLIEWNPSVNRRVLLPESARKLLLRFAAAIREATRTDSTSRTAEKPPSPAIELARDFVVSYCAPRDEKEEAYFARQLLEYMEPVLSTAQPPSDAAGNDAKPRADCKQWPDCGCIIRGNTNNDCQGLPL